MKGLPNQALIAARAFLKNQSGIEGVPISAGALTGSRHLQVPAARGTFKQAQYNVKIEFFSFFLKPHNLGLNMIKLDK